MESRFVWADSSYLSTLNFRMASLNILLHLMAALFLTGQFRPPCLFRDQVLLHSYPYLPVQHGGAWTYLSAPCTSTVNNTRTQYTSQQLRAVKPNSLNPSLIPHLRKLGIGYHLSSRRSCRGGRRRHRKILTVSPFPIIKDRTPIESEPWTADIVGVSDDLELPVRHMTNLSRVSFVSNQNNNIAPRGFLRVATYNAQSLGPDEKRTEVFEFIRDSNLDILFIQETWLKSKGDESKLASLTPVGYNVKSWPRNHRGGGIVIIFRDSLSKYLGFTSSFRFIHRTFELVVATLSFDNQHVNFACIYRTFPSKKNKLTDKMFFEEGEFPDFLDYFNILPGSSVILGDINFHYDQPSKTYEAKMIDILGDFGYSQSVLEPTHKKGHILDWVMHRPTDDIIKSTSVSNELVSDHHCVIIDINVVPPTPPSKFIEKRKIKSMDREAFGRDLSAISPEHCQTVEALDSALVACLDKHAPLVRKGIRTKHEDPWYPDIKEDLVLAKQRRRRAEKAWLKSGKLTVMKQIYDQAKKVVTYLVEKARKQYLSNKIANSDSSKELFNITNNLIGKEKSSPLPTCHPMSQLPNVFCNFFLEKTSKIREELDSQTITPSTFNVQNHPDTIFNMFQPVSEEVVRKTILSLKPTTCPLDPIPTPLLVEFLDKLLPIITSLINESLQTGKFPQSFKTAVVRPLLKKSSLDQNVLKNFRPVSNLSFLSKVFEKIVLNQLFDYLNTHNLLSHNQSAYRPAHSTETALVKVTNDILLALDRGDITVLTLLDLSAAFDTVDHDILFSSLSNHFGISGTALSWFKSYLTNRSQTVVIENFKSDSRDIIFGVPQGSVLGPVLFLMYTKPLLDSIDKQNILNQSFADDTQLYGSSKPEHAQQTISTIQNCIQGIRGWMLENKLKLNDEKTEALLFHSKSLLTQNLPSSITVGTVQIDFSVSARNLGYIISDDMTLNAHISHICRTAYTAIRQISTIRKYLTVEATKTLVCSFVLSRLDYCNSLLAGCPQHLINKLQKVQNSAARLILQARKHDHITPLLHALHWLPVYARINYKLSVLSHNFFYGSSPSYISNALTVYTPRRTLRSSADTLTLDVPRIHTARFGERSFSYAASKQWNSLPAELRAIQSSAAFKQKLKTYLFKKHYD